MFLDSLPLHQNEKQGPYAHPLDHLHLYLVSHLWNELPGALTDGQFCWSLAFRAQPNCIKHPSSRYPMTVYRVHVSTAVWQHLKALPWR